MNRLSIIALFVAAVGATVHHQDVQGHGLAGRNHQEALLQTWGKTLNSAAATPITRVVNLLKEMQATLQKEMADDEALYHELMCWCNDGSYEKEQEIEAAQNKIADLEASIEALTAKSGELSSSIKSLEEDIAANKKALAEATEVREKQAAEAHKSETEDIEALENLKAAIEVLSRHQGAAFPQLPISFLVKNSHTDKDAHKDRSIPWGPGHESKAERDFDAVWNTADVHDVRDDAQPHVVSPHHFLQQDEARPDAVATGRWSTHEIGVVRRALQSASAFVQRRHSYMPSYTAQSGEIMGILKELQDEMKASLSDAQKAEATAAANFAELKAAKTEEIESAEAQAERKEDELATTDNALANAKEEKTQVEASLSEDQKFMMNLKATCKDATKNFEERKSTRLAEIKAVADTISILTADQARDTFSATYSFVQVSNRREKTRLRRQAADVLRKAAARGRHPELSIMATSVELDAFTRVKEAIDKMVAQLKQQQADEVKTSDYCKAELQKNDMDTAKATSEKDTTEQSIASLTSKIETISDDTAKAKAEIASLQLELQRNTEDRVKQSMEFQKTIADQRATVGILKQAMERLAEFYDKADLMQTANHAHQAQKQTPPVVQKEYSPNEGQAGVMQMIEKLIYEAKDLEKETTKAEQEAVDAYAGLIATTNGSVAALMKQVSTLSSELAATKQEKIEAEGNLKDISTEIEGLAKYNADLHGECDFVLKNFDARQAGRQQEIEALLEAKAILSGA